MSEHENMVARLAGRTRYSREELLDRLEQGLTEEEIIRAGEDEDFAEALQMAAEIREAAEQIHERLSSAKHLEAEERYNLVRAAYRASERVVVESDDLAILLFEPEPEECAEARS